MEKYIQINLYATLKAYTPVASEKYPIIPGTTIKMLLEKLKVPLDQVKLIFVERKKAGLDETLNGGERVGIFPAVGGG
jgi:molybdopterin synthase sulfur carrier subunit